MAVPTLRNSCILQDPRRYRLPIEHIRPEVHSRLLLQLELQAATGVARLNSRRAGVYLQAQAHRSHHDLLVPRHRGLFLDRPRRQLHLPVLFLELLNNEGGLS